MNVIRFFLMNLSEEEKEKKLSIPEIITQHIKISFELMCGFLGSWGNPKIFYCKEILKPVKKIVRISKTFHRLVPKMFRKNAKFFGLADFPLLQKYIKRKDNVWKV